MKFKARFTREIEIHFEAENIENAASLLRAELTAGGGKWRVLGVLPVDAQWPDTIESKRSAPPRGTPPSGTPGTPVAQLEDQPVAAVAA